MNLLYIIMISIGISMDALAMSICKGISFKNMDFKSALKVALFFSTFQVLFPLIGYLLGNSFESFVSKIDHWIAFCLLVFIGFNMIREAYDKNHDNNTSLDFKNMVITSVAISVDALVIGMSFALLNVDVKNWIFVIFITTFLFSFLGALLGNKLGRRYEKNSKIVGGIILIIIGIKILLEHILGW